MNNRITITLTADEVVALRYLFDSAERGREDFEYLVSRNAGDYTDQDVAETRAQHKRERAVQLAISQQLATQGT